MGFKASQINEIINLKPLPRFKWVKSNRRTSTSRVPPPTLPLLHVPLVSSAEISKLHKSFRKIDIDNSGDLDPKEIYDVPGKE